MLKEANTPAVLDVISPELLDRVAYHLYADDEANLSAYERLMANDKRKKMDYLNNIRPDLIPNKDERKVHEVPAKEQLKPVVDKDDHHSIEDIPKSDPPVLQILAL